MDDFKKKLCKCGPGGIKCRCCRPVTFKGLKDRVWTRVTRRRLKQQTKRDIDNDRQEI